jgi:hypothetical protein
MSENQAPIQGQEKPKKPIFKRWWFWAIIIFVVIIAASSGSTENPTQTEGTSSPTSSSPAVPAPDDKSIKPGMYKVGTDFQPGEYVIVGSGYFEVTKDSTGQFDSIICNDNFQNRSIITVRDGEYIKIQSGKTYPFNEAPKVDSSASTLPSGMYKVGIDLQPGEYKLKSSGDGYVEVTGNSRHDLMAIVSNDNFSGEKYITIKAGQYIKLQRADLILK